MSLAGDGAGVEGPWARSKAAVDVAAATVANPCMNSRRYRPLTSRDGGTERVSFLSIDSGVLKAFLSD